MSTSFLFKKVKRVRITYSFNKLTMENAKAQEAKVITFYFTNKMMY